MGKEYDNEFDRVTVENPVFADFVDTNLRDQKVLRKSLGFAQSYVNPNEMVLDDPEDLSLIFAVNMINNIGVFDSEWKNNTYSIAQICIIIGYLMKDRHDTNFIVKEIAEKFIEDDIVAKDAGDRVIYGAVFGLIQNGFDMADLYGEDSSEPSYGVLPGGPSDTQEMEVYPNGGKKDDGGKSVDPDKLSAFADFVETLDLDDLEDDE